MVRAVAWATHGERCRVSGEGCGVRQAGSGRHKTITAAALGKYGWGLSFFGPATSDNRRTDGISRAAAGGYVKSIAAPALNHAEYPPTIWRSHNRLNRLRCERGVNQIASLPNAIHTASRGRRRRAQRLVTLAACGNADAMKVKFR